MQRSRQHGRASGPEASSLTNFTIGTSQHPISTSWQPETAAASSVRTTLPLNSAPAPPQPLGVMPHMPRNHR